MRRFKLRLSLGASVLLITAGVTIARADGLQSAQALAGSCGRAHVLELDVTNTLPVDDSFDNAARGHSTGVNVGNFSVINDFASFSRKGGGTGYEVERSIRDAGVVSLPGFAVAEIPEPATMVLLGTGLVALGALVRKRRSVD